MADENFNNENNENNENQNNENNENENGGSKSFSEEEVLKLIRSETDKALASQKKQYEKQLSLSKLDGDAREKAEKDNKIAELQEQLANFQIERNRSELKSVLSSRGLSAEFADIITISDDLDAAQSNIDKLDKLFKSAVKAEVDKRLAGNSPKGNGTGKTFDGLDEKAVRKMSLAEITLLEKNNPEIYKKYFG